uniref:Uncharacterized protein n=1 Tax=Anguilla anguilla TaxID=7936 RepID=A0A0E9TZG8_ANGAN
MYGSKEWVTDTFTLSHYRFIILVLLFRLAGSRGQVDNIMRKS